MITRSFLDLVNRLSPSVPGCPVPIIEQYIRDAAIEVCERTLIWRYKQPGIPLTKAIYDYPYEAPDDAEVHAVLAANLDEMKMQPVNLDQMHDLYPTWPYANPDNYSTPKYITQLDSDNFAVAPLPEKSGYYVYMIVALKPTRTASDMDKTALDDIESVVMHGALQHLLVLPDRSWSDRELASYHAKQYVYKISDRRAKANIGAVRSSMSVQMQSF